MDRCIATSSRLVRGLDARSGLPAAERQATGKPAIAPFVVLFAPCVLILVLSSTPAYGRPKGPEVSTEAACLSHATAANDVMASPCVTTPAAPVARFGVLELPAIASVVHVRCLAEVMVARIGGLYGP